MTAEYKTMKDSNRKLKEAVDQLNRKIKDIEEKGEVANVLTIGEKVISSTAEEIDLASEGITDE